MKKFLKVQNNIVVFFMILMTIVILSSQNTYAYESNLKTGVFASNNKQIAYADNLSKIKYDENKNIRKSSEKDNNQNKKYRQDGENPQPAINNSTNLREVKNVFGFFNFFTANSYENLIKLAKSIAIFMLFLLFRKIFTKYVFNIIIKMTSKTKTDMDEKFFLAFEKPLRSMFIILGTYFALKYLGDTFLIKDSFIKHCLNSAVIIVISIGLYNLTAEYSVLYDEMKNLFGLKVDKILFPFISRCLRVIIVALAVTLFLAEWGKNIQMFITGVGLGGLAFSLAAQDAVSNIISGIILIIEKPFKLGDWISTSEVEGVVEDINFRSTRIRTFSQELVTVPNSKLASVPVTNYTKRGKRRITFNLGVTYDTPKEKLETCVNRIKNMLEEHADVHKETILVNFDKFNDSSLDIFLYFFTKTICWEKHLKIKEDINFKIMDILQEEDVSCAFPSTSVYFETPIKNENYMDVLEYDNRYEKIG